MDAKITKQRLANLFAYDWIKILVAIAAAITAWIVLLSTIGTKATEGQQMFFIYYSDVYEGADQDSLTQKLLRSDTENSVFSPEVFESNSMFLSSDRSYAGMALSMRMAAGQHSFAFVSTKENGEKTYLEQFLTDYYPLLEELDKYFADAESFFASYYHGDVEQGALDEEFLESSFRSRAVGDKRYRTEKNIQKGILLEKERIEQTKNSYLVVKKALAEGLLGLTTSTVKDVTTGESKTGNFSLDLSSPRFTSFTRVAYVEGDLGAQTNVGMNVCLFALAKENQQYMRFEKLNYLSYLITNYSDPV